MANPDGDKPRFKSLEVFACASMCRRYATRLLDAEQRAAACCVKPDFDTTAWTATNLEHEHMGAEPDYEAEGTDPRWQNPPERPEDEGCPGAWYRCAFVQSLLKFHRPMDGHGNRIDHHAYREVVDPFVQECLRVWEAEEMAADSYRHRVMNQG